jgi:hypothetical protein
MPFPYAFPLSAPPAPGTAQRYHPYPVPGGRHPIGRAQTMPTFLPTLGAPQGSAPCAGPFYAWPAPPGFLPVPVPLGMPLLFGAPWAAGAGAGGLPSPLSAPPGALRMPLLPPPAAVLPRHPQLVAHAQFVQSLQEKRTRIVRWARDVSAAGAGEPDPETRASRGAPRRSRTGARREARSRRGLRPEDRVPASDDEPSEAELDGSEADDGESEDDEESDADGEADE